MDINNKQGFALGDLQVSPSHNQLSAHGQTLKLQPKAMAVLQYLACHHERVISNEELLERLWEGRIVTHGSVQKSINALRSAFSQLVGEQELIAHYSKRGYQLTLAPQFVLPNQQLTPANAQLIPITHASNRVARPQLWLKATVGIALGLMLALVLWRYYAPTPKVMIIPKHHITSFQASVGYTHETGHERNAVPHPDNIHVAYIREKFNAKGFGETQSDIMVRDDKAKDWQITTSEGSWFKLAWSPTGKHLVAIEVKRSEGQPYTPHFYEKPNYLYSFHIFSLDLANDRLLEKQQLSQWQGRIYSVTWWDENTLEFVAKQGPGAVTARYRYSTLNQHLSLLDELEGAANPVASAVHNKITALASLHKNAIQIDFLAEDQTRLSRWQLNVPAVDISWIPDGSGILIYAEDTRSLSTLYRDGQRVQIPLTDNKDRVFSRPRYRPDGTAIFYTEEKRSSNIVLMDLQGTSTRLTENTDFNYAASFSPQGDKIVYASVRNNQIHLWLVEGGQERQLTSQPIEKKVGAIVWSDDGEHLLYNAGTQLYDYNLLSATSTLLFSDSDKVEPLAYFPQTHQLLLVKSSRDQRNLWRIDTKNNQQRQLSFGSVGSAIEYKGDVFFQYASENGLWVLRNKSHALEQVLPNLAGNIKLLGADDQGVYFMAGGLCRESDIYYVDYATKTQSTRLVRDNRIISTTSFHPAKGALQTECYLAEANIVLLK